MLASSNDCRISFATNFYAQREYPMPLLMSVTGHKTETMFLNYIVINQQIMQCNQLEFGQRKPRREYSRGVIKTNLFKTYIKQLSTDIQTFRKLFNTYITKSIDEANNLNELLEQLDDLFYNIDGIKFSTYLTKDVLPSVISKVSHLKDELEKTGKSRSTYPKRKKLQALVNEFNHYTRLLQEL